MNRIIKENLDYFTLFSSFIFFGIYLTNGLSKELSALLAMFTYFILLLINRFLIIKL